MDACEDDDKLEAVEALLQETGTTDWWQKLSESEKQKTIVSLNQADEGHVITYQQLMEKLWTKFTN